MTMRTKATARKRKTNHLRFNIRVYLIKYNIVYIVCVYLYSTARLTYLYSTFVLNKVWKKKKSGYKIITIIKERRRKKFNSFFRYMNFCSTVIASVGYF